MNGIYNKAEHVQILKPRSNGIILQYLVIRKTNFDYTCSLTKFN